jgi:hypothetical protein
MQAYPGQTGLYELRAHELSLAEGRIAPTNAASSSFREARLSARGNPSAPAGWRG